MLLHSCEFSSITVALSTSLNHHKGPSFIHPSTWWIEVPDYQMEAKSIKPYNSTTLKTFHKMAVHYLHTNNPFKSLYPIFVIKSWSRWSIHSWLITILQVLGGTAHFRVEILKLFVSFEWKPVHTATRMRRNPMRMDYFWNACIVMS